MPAGPGATSRLVEHELRIAAAPEIVFAYFTDPARMVEWFGHAGHAGPAPRRRVPHPHGRAAR